eukprot:jgi/Phyca11/508176/fgenesh2_kg.PHYCAscaffold_33_\
MALLTSICTTSFSSGSIFILFCLSSLCSFSFLALCFSQKPSGFHAKGSPQSQQPPEEQR